MINRTALILRYKEPAIRWINETDPVNKNPGITQMKLNQDRTVYLISERDGENDKILEKWIKLNYKNLFESELEDWYTDPDLWPTPLTLKLFHKWFTVECHSVLIDTVGGKIFDDDL
jgi:hypothetical protein